MQPLPVLFKGYYTEQVQMAQEWWCFQVAWKHSYLKGSSIVLVPFEQPLEIEYETFTNAKVCSSVHTWGPLKFSTDELRSVRDGEVRAGDVTEP